MTNPKLLDGVLVGRHAHHRHFDAVVVARGAEHRAGVVIAALIGVCDAFFYPAAMSSVPKMIEKARLPAANALIQTGDQITQIAGPALAGVLMFTVVVFDPFSQGLAGVMLDVSLTALFVGAGVLMIVTGLATLGNKVIRAETEAIDAQAAFKDPIDPQSDRDSAVTFDFSRMRMIIK